MCGIVGYVGFRKAIDFLLPGLRRLEYRGYDSAGIATLTNWGDASIEKSVGRIDALAEQIQGNACSGAIGIGHTRWATHGPPNQVNAHPHVGGEGEVVLAHNGVIENYQALKERLEADGFVFRSATDTEVIAHLIADCLRKQQPLATNSDPHAPFLAAVKMALAKLRGTYGLVVLFPQHPDVIIAARLGSPLVVGVGEGEHFVASDASPLVGYTDKIVQLSDHEVAVITASGLRVTHRDRGHVRPQVNNLEIAANDVELGSFAHYMLKEIYDQPEAIENALRGHLSEDNATSVFGELTLTPQELRNVDRMIFTACGTSYHASLVGEFLMEEKARIPVEVDYASELRYRNPAVNPGTLLFSITQSGETADTLAALRELKRKGHPTIAICNVVGSTISQEADSTVFLHAGPEIGVASTKAYTSQCTMLAMLSLYFGRMHHLSYCEGREFIDALHRLPDAVRRALDTNAAVRRVAEKYCHVRNMLYLGRQYNFPTALEGALKLKEITYIHAEGYPAGEMKHGPIALVDKETPSVFIMPQGFVYDKTMSNMEEIKARGGPIIAVAAEGDTRVQQIADDVIYIPVVEEFLQPIVTIVPLQLFAYHMAVLRGCDVDKPRNLAKSVTVE